MQVPTCGMRFSEAKKSAQVSALILFGMLITMAKKLLMTSTQTNLEDGTIQRWSSMQAMPQSVDINSTSVGFDSIELYHWNMNTWKISKSRFALAF